MNEDERGMSFFTEDGDDGPERKPSVFGSLDQGDMIARIEATDEDDLSSSFFGDSIQDVEDAAVRMFDIGIRTITDEAPESRTAFGTRPPEPEGTRADGALPVGAVGLFADAGTRAAFILGGPAALGRQV